MITAGYIPQSNEAFWGEAPDIDEESNLSHLSHALCNIAFLIAYEENKERYRTFDDRAGNHNSYYKERERVIDKIINLVQDDPGFFECGIGDNKLQKVYDTLDYAINASPRFSDQLDFPDLTKMSHPEACKHLEVGMKVKVLFKGESHARGWGNCWCNMGEAIGNEFIVETVEKYGIRFKDSGFWQGFPAFVLEIVSGPEDTE